MAGSSNEPDAYVPEQASDGIPEEIGALKEDLKYMLASNVNVSSFVSVKLSGSSNYVIWKCQMLFLIESQMLHSIIDNNSEMFRIIIGDQDRMKYKYDNLVKGWIFGSVNDIVLKDLIRRSYDSRSWSARFVWTELEKMYNQPTPDDDEVEFKFREIILSREAPETENITDDSIRRKRILCEAAEEGCWWKAKSILKNHKNAFKEAIDENGNTILHIAVEMGHNYFVEKLVDFLTDNGEDIMETKNNKGRTALHIAGMVLNIDAARLLVKKRKQLLVIEDNNRETPWDVSFDLKKPDVYMYLMESTIDSGLHYSVSDKGAYAATVAAIRTNQYDLAKKVFGEISSELFITESLKTLTLTFPTDLGFTESFIYPSFDMKGLLKTVKGSLLVHYNVFDKCVDDILRVEKNCTNACCSWLGKFSMILLVPIVPLYVIFKLISIVIMVLHLTVSSLYFIVWKVLASIVPPIKNIENKKKEYEKAKELLSLMCGRKLELDSNWKKISPIMTLAVCEGCYEVVDEILFRSPRTIMCKDDEGHNVIQLAIINRSEKIFNLIRHIITTIQSSRNMIDSSKNNLAHLAGRLAPSSALARTTGAALQLQRELIWNNEVKKLMSPIVLAQENGDMETPATIFTNEHKDLLKEGEDWMKTTAESCSITAALIVTIVFAAAITVPGGNQESGIPVFKNEFAFTVFAVTNAFSLFTGVAALLMFLSILTARFSEKDFLVSLPRRLILGLLGLFLSTTTMIVAFGAILFLVFCDQRPWMLAPIFVFSCLPLAVIVFIKLPLLFDLIGSTYIPIFGNKSYLKSCKTNSENTIFIR